MTHHEHHHHEGSEQDDTYGIALGVRILEEGGELYLAEAEISPYVDQPEELGATLVFHPLAGLNPVEAAESEADWPSWPIDIDDELVRNGSEPIPAQFQAIARQLRELTEDELREYLKAARDDAGE